MSQCLGVLFPVLAVELDDIHPLRSLIEAVQVDIDAIRVGTGRVKRLYAADLTEGVPGHAGIEAVGSEGAFAGEQAESTQGNNQVQKSTASADGAITALDLDLLGCLDFEADGAAVAAAGVDQTSPTWSMKSSRLW